MSGITQRELCALAPVIPVLVVEEAATASELGRALVAGGLPALEVTLRTPAALAAIRAMSEIEGAVVGAGTLRSAADVTAAVTAGARFGVSPGCTDGVARAAEDAGLPLLPGVATPTEAMRAADRGFETLKFFPAEQAGGAAMLKAWAGPLAGLAFCPTGGITPANAPAYLALPNVACVGGSWVAPRGAVGRGDWAEIEALARTASALAR